MSQKFDVTGPPFCPLRRSLVVLNGEKRCRDVANNTNVKVYIKSINDFDILKIALNKLLNEIVSRSAVD